MCPAYRRLLQPIVSCGCSLAICVAGNAQQKAGSPSAFEKAFVVPASDEDQRGNPVVARAGEKSDPATGRPYEIWLKEPKIEFVLVPAGQFRMGSSLSPEQTVDKYGGTTQRFKDEQPQHQVQITKPFYLGKYEVTNAQFRQFRAEHDSKAHRGHTLDEDSHPVVHVSWEDAMAFCKWIGERSGLTVRPPTEAEWEYACRAGTRTPFYWGAEMDVAYCSFADKSVPLKRDATELEDGYTVTAPVGRYKPNAFGLHDMLGNVYEWCADGKRAYSADAVSDPRGPDSDPRALRGGSWGSQPRFARCANRYQRASTHKGNIYGFRVSVEIP